MIRIATVHAIERFKERWGAELSYASAAIELDRLLATAVRSERRTPKGDEVWMGDGRIPLVCRRDGSGRSKTLVCVTVIAWADWERSCRDVSFTPTDDEIAESHDDRRATIEMLFQDALAKEKWLLEKCVAKQRELSNLQLLHSRAVKERSDLEKKLKRTAVGR